MFQSFVGLIASVVVAFIYNTKIGIVNLCFVPLTALAAKYQLSTFITLPDQVEKDMREERILMSDSLIHHSTVASLCNEEQFITSVAIRSKRSILLSGLAYAVSWFLCNFYFFVTFYATSKIILHGDSFIDVFTGICAGIFGSTQLGVALQNAPDWTKGKLAAIKVLNILNSPPEGTPYSSVLDGEVDLIPEFASGDIEFRNVWFRYPSNENWVLQNFNLKIKNGQSVGLAGESGCGKSTIINLLLRFYDPQRGEILLNNIPIKAFTLRSLRAQFGLVQQEPIIFNCSIMENISYGKSHATANEVEKAAEISQSLDFIKNLNKSEFEDSLTLECLTSETRFLSLDSGYKLKCGTKGGNLSGGQKQRIAIARAVIRNPKVLLLDEATSALDESCQSAVQQTLDQVTSTATSIVIAHRLTTLSKCDRIVVIMDGNVVEDGSYEGLKQKGGVFAQYISDESI